MHKIKTALCSFGMSGKVFHAPFLQVNEGFELYGVWERSKKEAATLYPAIRSYDQLDDLLANPEIELVIVNTPNHTHFEFSKKALLAGKHVLVEKAFTVTVIEAEELISIAGKTGKQLAVFQNRRYDSDFKTVKKIVDEGSLGQIIEAEFHFDRYNLNLSTKKHKETPNLGAGLLHDLGPHLIDQALYLFGMPGSLFGFLATTRPGSMVNDYFDILLFYPDLRVRLKAGLIVKEPLPAYSLHGINGSFIKQRGDIQEDELKKGNKPGSTGWGTEPSSANGILNILVDGVTVRKPVPSLQGNYMQFYNELYEAIVHGKKIPVSGQDGLNTMRVIEAVQQADKTKRIVSLNEWPASS
jgi:predicted dehydrogenase